ATPTSDRPRLRRSPRRAATPPAPWRRRLLALLWSAVLISVLGDWVRPRGADEGVRAVAADPHRDRHRPGGRAVADLPGQHAVAGPPGQRGELQRAPGAAACDDQ